MRNIAFNSLPPSRVQLIVLEGAERAYTGRIDSPGTITITSPGVTTRLSWSLPKAGSYTMTVLVTYNSAIDVSGARPYAVLYQNTGLGISNTNDYAAPSGAGTQTITIPVTVTGGGVLTVDLVVPNSGLDALVTWQVNVNNGSAVGGGPSGSKSSTFLRSHTGMQGGLSG